MGQLYDKRRRHQSLFFVPTCLEDGTFAPVQCYPEAEYCWCVTPAGKPIPNSSLRHARPNCTRRGEDHLRVESTKESPRIVGSVIHLAAVSYRLRDCSKWQVVGVGGSAARPKRGGEKSVSTLSLKFSVGLSVVCCSHVWKTKGRNSESE